MLRRRTAQSLNLLALLFIVVLSAWAESPSNPGIPRDWSHSKLIVTNAAPPEVALASQREPRMFHNWFYRTTLLRRKSDGYAGLGGEAHVPGRHQPAKRDWNVTLGNGNVAPAQFPAKFNFSLTATPSCANDYVVYGLNVPGVNGSPSAGIAAASGAVRSSNVVTITTSSAHNFPVGAQVTITGVSNTSFNGTFAIASIPSTTKFTYQQTGTNATSGNGTATLVNQANLIAFNNLYSGTTPANGICGSGAATVMWAYNASTAGGKVLTSPSLSLDGTKIFYVESAPSSSIFHVLAWSSAAGNGASATSPAAPGSGNSASLRSLTYASATNTRSSPWIDYSTDSAYVAADNGLLYKITNISGTPALAGAPWPVTVSAGAILTAPVYDTVSGNIFLGDSNGKLWAVKASTGAIVGSLQVGAAAVAGGGIVDPPLVDAGSGTVFAFSANDKSGTNTAAVVVQANTSMTQLARAHIGHGSFGETTNAINLHAGTFDNNYFALGPSSGFLGVCGTSSTNTNPTVYTLSFTGTRMNTNPTFSQQINTANGAECSPITEIYNTGTNTDYFFIGQTKDCFGTGTSGCIYNATLAGINTPVAESGGTSGIVVDNVSTSAQASSIYFSTLGTTKSAVKLTQAALQ